MGKLDGQGTAKSYPPVEVPDIPVVVDVERLHNRFELAAVESVIENEIAQGLDQKQIAQTYALAMRSSWPTDWKRVNEAILKRWPKGLQRIKKMAGSVSISRRR